MCHYAAFAATMFWLDRVPDASPVILVLFDALCFPLLFFANMMCSGPASEMMEHRQLLLFLLFMAANSFLVGYTIAWLWKSLRTPKTGPREPPAGGD